MKLANHHAVVFVEHVPYPHVQYFLSRSQVHCLPSFRESPGLATLEAAINGCKCVVSCHSPVQEYFKSSLFFKCDPLSLNSLTNAIHQAASSASVLTDSLLQEYTSRSNVYSSLTKAYNLLDRN